MAKAQEATSKQDELEAKVRAEIYLNPITRHNQPKSTYDVCPQMKELDELKAKQVKDLQVQLRQQALKTVSGTSKHARVYIFSYISVLCTRSVTIFWL